MKKLSPICLLIFLWCSAPGYAQLTQPQLDSLTQKYARDLRSKGVDTLCIYNEYCVGCVFQPVKGSSLCLENFSSLPTYIFWKENGKTFITRKDICFDYNTQLIAEDQFWSYYFANRDKIKKEQLKTPQYIESANGRKTTRSLDIDHSIYFRISLVAGNEAVIKDINSFYFTKDLGVEGALNINYEYNMRTSLNHLHNLLQKVVKQEALKKRFVRTLR